MAPLRFVFAIGLFEECGEFGVVEDLVAEAFSKMCGEGFRCLALVEIGRQVGPDGPAAVVAGGPSRGIDILQQISAFVREAQV